MRKASLILMLLIAVLSAARAGDEENSPTKEQRAQFLKAFAKLGSDSYKERREAARKIAELGPPVLALLEERKGHPDPEVSNAVERLIKQLKLDIARRRIIKLIKETGVDDDPAQILEKYSSPKEEDRMQALMRLTSRHTPACVPVVMEFLNDPSDKIVDMAIAELRQVVKGKDEKLALRILSVAGRTPPEEERVVDRINAFLAFADYRCESLVDAVKKLKDKKVREMVFTRMVLVPEENFAFVFAAMLGDDDRFTRRYCAGGLEVIVREVLLKDGSGMFSFNSENLKRLSSVLATHLDSSDPVVLQVVTGAIGRTGVPDSADRLVALLGSTDLSTARRAAISLGLVKARKAVPALIALIKEGNYEVMPESAAALARIGSPASYKPLLELLKNRKIPFRELLLYAMAEVDLKRSADELPAFLSDPDISVRSLAVDRLVKALTRYPELAASKLPALLQIVRKGQAGAKAAAARVIGEVGSVTILPELRRLAASSDPQVRAAIFLPIAMIAQESARTLLTKNLKDPNYAVRVQAAHALGYLGDWSEFLKVRLVPLEVKGESLTDALKRIAWATGINLVIDPAAIRMSSLDTCVVSFPLKGKTLSEALARLGKRFGLSWDAAHYVLFVTVQARSKVLGEFSIPSASVGCTEADLAIEKKLSSRVTCDSVSEEIGAFFEKLSTKTGIKFTLDETIENRLAESLRKVDFTASDIPLGELLRLVLAPRGLSARITGGSIAISPRK